MNIDLDRVARLERDVRQGSRDGGTFGPAVDDTFDAMRALVAELTDLRFSTVCYLNRAVRAEEAAKELAAIQDLYERAKRDVERLSSQADTFRKSWLDYRDRCEVLRSDLAAAKKSDGGPRDVR